MQYAVLVLIVTTATNAILGCISLGGYGVLVSWAYGVPMYCAIMFLTVDVWPTHLPLVCRMIKLGLSIDEDDAAGEDADEDLPPLEENVDEGSRMEEVD